LLCHRIIDHAAAIHGNQEVVTRSVEGRSTAPTTPISAPARWKVGQQLDRRIKLGDRVATIAWNTWRHLEAWYGIMGIGAICHTVNPRLFPDQIVWIVNHAQDRIMMTDLTFVPLLEKIADKMPSGRTLRRIHRQSAHAADHAEERDRLRRLDRGSRRQFRVEGVRREHRRCDVLHVRHDR
jgi:acyl-CoA synthetase (AMP-forming)/AMP-acid ligase II